MAVGFTGYPLTSFALLVSDHAAAPYILGDGVDDSAKEGGFDDPKDTAAASSSSPPSPPLSEPASWIEHQKEQGGFTAPLPESTSHPHQQARRRRKKSSLTIREQSKDLLKEKLFSELLEGESRVRFARDRIRCKKVLVVFDDVDDAEQCRQFITGGWFGPESRIIITSRDKQVLRNIGVIEPYEVEGLDYVEALELFSLHAFKKNSPTANRKELSNRAVHYAGGIPLALRVLGCHLLSRGIEVWESTLGKLEKFPKKDIQKVLRISYDALDDAEKDIFLDIACILKGQNRGLVEQILNGCGLYSTAGIEVLIDKALITIGHRNTVEMHHLLQMMAFEIVRPQSSNQDPRKGSRLWNAEDIYEALKNDRGLETIEGIFLDTSKCNQVISLLPTTFLKMCGLRLLIINGSNLCLPQGPPAFPDTLRYLSWVACPLKLLSANFIGEKLVVLEMIGSQLEKLWDGAPNLGNLKSINLSGSLHLTQVPDLSWAPNIESVNLLCCASLTEVPSYFQHLTKLKELTLIGCPSLSKLSGLPKSLTRLEIVTRPLVLSLYHDRLMRNCRSWFLSRKFSSKLERFPKILEPMEFLVTLHLDFAAIKELPLSITNVTGLIYLSLSFGQNLEFLPDLIHSLSSLKGLNISFCQKLESIPVLPSSVSHIDARGCTSLKTVPNSIPLMVKQNWDDLSLSDCQYEEFKFFGCEMLDENARRVLMEEALFRILRYATLVSKYGSDEITSFQIYNRSCWPGSEIPRWFSHKSDNSSICMNLPHPDQWSDSSSYLGLAVCLILRLDYRTDEGLAGEWHSDYKFPNDDSRKKVYNIFPNGDSKCLPLTFSYEDSYYHGTGCRIVPVYNETSEEKMDGAFISETVFVFVDHRYGEFLRSKKFPRRQVGSASFFFHMDHATVMKCGVRLIHRQEAERFGYVRQVDQSESSGDHEAVYYSDQDEEDEEEDNNGGGESDSDEECREAIHFESDDQEEDR